jgi:coenzyme F420-reducing hydrogenase beta subunit
MGARKNRLGRWEARFTTPPNARGQKLRLYVVCPPAHNTKEFCNTLVRQAVDRHLGGVAPSKLTFGQFFEKIFMAEYPAAKNLEASSVQAYRYLVGKIACDEIGGKPIASIDGGVVARLIARLREQTKIDGAISLEEGRRARARAAR